ncbi:MAG TPA: hypothetical protein VFZ89_04835 [Solirubrobacteraceae bacterium]
MTRAVVLGAVAATLLAATPAEATLVYTKNATSPRFKPSVWVANDDGTSPRRLATGRSGRISPDGSQVLFVVVPRDPERYKIKLFVVPTAGGAPRRLVTGIQNIFDIVWSPDGTRALVVAGGNFGPYNLTLVDVPAGTSRTIVKGFFYGFGFSPDGQQIVYSRAPREVLQIDADLFTVPVAGGVRKRIPTNNPAVSPVWGPQYIAYSQARLRRNDAPVYQIHRVQPDGSANSVMTRTRVPKLVWGLTPTAFSADGTRLLAQFGGQDTSYAVAVDPATGAERVLGPRGNSGLLASRLSKDGQLVLAASGGYDELAKSDIVTIPWTGGPTTVLVRNADDPDWNR